VAHFFFPCGCGEGELFLFQVVFGVENGLSIVHFPLGQWTVDIPCKLLFLFVCLLGSGYQSKELRSS
jgi:hypothetical protein